MSDKPTRDPDTGEIKINGKFGAFLAWTTWLGKILLLPAIIYMGAHEVRHARLDDFVGTGPRLTPDMLEDRLNLYKADVIQYVGENYPPQALLAKVEENSRKLQEIQVQVAGMDARLTTEMQAIRRILED